MLSSYKSTQLKESQNGNQMEEEAIESNGVCDSRLKSREHEELAKEALLLKRKELRWKLMQASHIRNQAKLEEIKVEAVYNKKKMIKITALANKLRARYIKVAKAAKNTEALCKKIEQQLLLQEKFVADGRMQLTKVAVECRKMGTQLYGPTYKLDLNSLTNHKQLITSSEQTQNSSSYAQNLAMLKLQAAKLALKRSQLIELRKKTSLNSPAQKLLAPLKAKEDHLTEGVSMHKEDLESAQASSSKITSIELRNVLTPRSTTSNVVETSETIEDNEDEVEPIVTLDDTIPYRSTKSSNTSHIQKLAPFLRRSLVQTHSKAHVDNSKISISPKKRKQQMQQQQPKNQPVSLPVNGYLSPIYNWKESSLRNIAAYRLTSKFLETGLPLTDLNYAHNICPMDYICLPDLIGVCTDKDCLYQHKSNYIMSDIDKLADLLSYKPTLIGFKPDPSLSQGENDNACRLKLKQYAAKVLARNPSKSVETLARDLVKHIQSNKPDHKLLTGTRKLPKVSHFICNGLSKARGLTAIENTTNEENKK